MTKLRNDLHSTEFGLWLRGQLLLQTDVSCIDSKLGYVTTNIDYIWENYKTGDWMFIEEKRYMSGCGFSQKNQFIKLNSKIKDKSYHGFHLLQFEKTSPEDGKIYLDNKEITKEKLLKFLSFKI